MRRWRTLVLLAGLLSAGGCGDDGAAPRAGDELDGTATSAHYVYLFSTSDPAPVDTVWQETWHRWVLEELQLEHPWRVEYRKYRDQEHLTRVTGHSQGTGRADPEARRIHTIWRTDNHEATHVLWSQLVGEPPSFFNEGVAVAHHADPIQNRFDRSVWNDRDVHEVARGYVLAGSLPDLDRLVETNEFWDLDQGMTYPVAGSFVRWLVDRRGIQSFKAFSAAVARGDGPATVRARFQEVYATSLDQAWSDWRGFLEAY